MSTEHHALTGVTCVDGPAATSTSAPGRVGINDLSNEILLQIINRVGNDSVANVVLRNPRHLLSLALCSRRLHKLTEPVLYSGFTQSIYAPKSDKNFLLYLRRILASPHLARCLKQFCGAARLNDTDSLLPVASELTDLDWTRLRRAVHGVSASDDEAATWIQAVEKGEWHALVAVLLSVAPNIEELAFTNWAYQNDDYTYLLLFLDRARTLQDSVEESPFAMSKLRNVSVHYWDTEGGFGFDVLKPFLDIKSVQVFHGHTVSEDSIEIEGGTDFKRKDPPPAFRTKDLTFTNSVISHDDMVLILRCFPQLERFHFEFGGALVGYYGFEPPRMMAALEHLKPCLQSLTLLSEEWHGMSDMELYPIGSLADFQRLVSITTNATVMIGRDSSHREDSDSDASENGMFCKTQNLIDAVPSTLEFLSLKDCSDQVVRHIFELVTQKEFRTPVLRTIDLGWEGVKYPKKESPRGPIIHPGFSKEEVNKLLVECEAAGIEVVIKYLPPKPKYVSFQKPGDP